MAKKQNQKHQQKQPQPSSGEGWEARLASLLDGVKAPGSVFCQGGDVPAPASFTVQGLGSLALPLQPEQAAQLLEAGEAAPFGKGSATLLDPAVRRATQVDASRLPLDGV
jgi:hypothetical protein